MIEHLKSKSYAGKVLPVVTGDTVCRVLASRQATLGWICIKLGVEAHACNSGTRQMETKESKVEDHPHVHEVESSLCRL